MGVRPTRTDMLRQVGNRSRALPIAQDHRAHVAVIERRPSYRTPTPDVGICREAGVTAELRDNGGTS
jgi:hypothetical protein